MDTFKNILMQIFVLLPIAAIESAASLTIVFFIVSFFQPDYDMGIVMPIVFLVICLGILVGMFFLEKKIRDFDELGFSIFFIVTMPIRIVIQLLSVIFSIISIFWDIIDSDYEYCGDTVGETVTYVLLGCTFDVDRRDKPERFGEKDIRLRNILMQLFVLLPVAAAQFFLSLLAFHFLGNVSSPDADPLTFLWLFLILLGLILLSTISTALRGHEATGEYYDDKYVYSHKDGSPYLSDEEFDEQFRNGVARGDPEIEGYKRERGGWTMFFRPVTILCFFSSCFLVFTQVLSILIAPFINPYKGRVFAWYGEVDYSRCDHPFLQRLLHFYLGFVIFNYEY